VSAKNPIKLRPLLSLHRTLGLISALFVLLLAITGLLLQHTSLLRLDSRYLRSDFWLGLYGLEVPSVTTAFLAGDHSAALLEDSLYFDLRPVADSVTRLAGLVEIQSLFVLATASELLLLTAEGETVEVLSSLHGVPQSMERLGRTSGGELVIDSQGQTILVDLDELIFEVSAATNSLSPSWSQPVVLTPALQVRLASAYGDRMINLERLVLDLHSGRLIGSWGVVLMDLMALLFMTMAITGLWIWSKRRAARADRQSRSR
jgi:hypothetical protein